MMDLPLISVIVPVYGVEEYLDLCVASIAGQTYRNLEILLVDDGSPDACGVMCDAWAEKDGRIRVIHKENGGLSDARNAGIRQATGTLVGFVDSDDWIDSNMYQSLYEQLCATGSDIACGGTRMFWEDDTPARMLTEEFSGVLENREAMIAILEQTGIKQTVWNKLYKRELLQDLSFPVGKCHEDAFWSYRVIARAEKVCICPQPLYHYRQRSNSIMGKSYSLKRLDALEAQFGMMEFIQKEYPALYSAAKCKMLFDCMYAMERAMLDLTGEAYHQAYQIIHTYVANTGTVKLSGAQGLKNKIWLLLAQIWFDGVCRLQLWLESR